MYHRFLLDIYLFYSLIYKYLKKSCFQEKCIVPLQFTQTRAYLYLGTWNNYS